MYCRKISTTGSFISLNINRKSIFKQSKLDFDKNETVDMKIRFEHTPVLNATLIVKFALYMKKPIKPKFCLHRYICRQLVNEVLSI